MTRLVIVGGRITMAAFMRVAPARTKGSTID